MRQLIAIVGPSGAGKDSLIVGAMQERADLRLVRRVITRPESVGGEDFEGVTRAVFAARKAAGDFALDWEAHGLCYGLPKTALDHQGTVLFNGSRAALSAAVQLFPDLRVIVVTAPDEVLATRLALRARESAPEIHERLTRAAFSLPDGISATIVVNDGTLAEGVSRLLAAIQPERA